MVRFGWNLAQLFMDSPWIFDPGYTQIRQVNQSTFRVNTLKLWPRLKPNQTSQHLESTRGLYSSLLRETCKFILKKLAPFIKKMHMAHLKKKTKPLISAVIKNSIFLKSTEPLLWTLWVNTMSDMPKKT